jgi:hypothetical protein
MVGFNDVGAEFTQDGRGGAFAAAKAAGESHA